LYLSCLRLDDEGSRMSHFLSFPFITLGWSCRMFLVYGGLESPCWSLLVEHNVATSKDPICFLARHLISSSNMVMQVWSARGQILLPVAVGAPLRKVGFPCACACACDARCTLPSCKEVDSRFGLVWATWFTPMFANVLRETGWRSLCPLHFFWSDADARSYMLDSQGANNYFLTAWTWGEKKKIIAT